jgi:preprotein translocase subunit YajC
MNFSTEMLAQIGPLLAMGLIFYFLLIRPQQQKVKSHQKMLEGICRGDKVITNGGLIGTVVKLTSDRELLVEISEGVKVRVVRSMIADVPAKIEAANSENSKSKKDTTAQ